MLCNYVLFNVTLTKDVLTYQAKYNPVLAMKYLSHGNLVQYDKCWPVSPIFLLHHYEDSDKSRDK